ncbi:MAG TPA: hypothetical protein VIL28_16220, partial [Steroidobacteraceae bacterium]
MPEVRPADVDVGKLFRNLSEHWYRPSSPVDANFTRLARSVDMMFERLRTSERLAFLSKQFYPEWRNLLETPPPLDQAEEMWRIPDAKDED